MKVGWGYEMQKMDMYGESSYGYYYNMASDFSLAISINVGVSF